MTVHYISSIEYVAVNTIHGLKLFPANIRTHAYMRHFRTIFMTFSLRSFSTTTQCCCKYHRSCNPQGVLLLARDILNPFFASKTINMLGYHSLCPNITAISVNHASFQLKKAPSGITARHADRPLKCLLVVLRLSLSATTKADNLTKRQVFLLNRVFRLEVPPFLKINSLPLEALIPHRLIHLL